MFDIILPEDNLLGKVWNRLNSNSDHSKTFERYLLKQGCLESTIKLKNIFNNISIAMEGGSQIPGIKNGEIWQRMEIVDVNNKIHSKNINFLSFFYIKSSAENVSRKWENEAKAFFVLSDHIIFLYTKIKRFILSYSFQNMFVLCQWYFSLKGHW